MGYSMKRSILLRALGLSLFVSLLQSSGYSQKSCLVRGIVVDRQTSSSIPYVNVLVHGTTWGTATDTLGKFRLVIPVTKTYLLTFSHIGYASELSVIELQAGDTLDITVSMAEASIALPGVITTARDQRRVAINATRIASSEEIERFAPSNLRDALVRTFPQVGSPWGPRPLVYIDGVPADWHELEFIDPYGVQEAILYRGHWAPIQYQRPAHRDSALSPRAGRAPYVIVIRTK
jgi:hypothetical protein